MKELYIVRHAKSSWGDLSLPDFDRPLNERGKKDAPEMAKRLKVRNIKPDAFITSPAKRARKTCKIFCEILEANEKKIIEAERLYLADEATIYEIIAGLDSSCKRVAIFSHNPGITDFVNSLNPEIHIDNVPTCGVFAVTCNIKKWDEFKIADKKFLFFDYPRLS